MTIFPGTQAIAFAPSHSSARPRLEAEIPLKTTLIVDDDRAVLGLAGIILAKMGYAVLKARNAEEALGLFQANKPLDLAITEVSLGAMDGLKLGELLRANQPGLKILFTSGGRDDQRPASRKWGFGSASPLLRKPFLPRELQSSVTALMVHDRKRPAR